MALILRLNPKEIIKITTKSGEIILVQAPNGDNSNQKLVFNADKDVEITRCLKMKVVVLEDLTLEERN